MNTVAVDPKLSELATELPSNSAGAAVLRYLAAQRDELVASGLGARRDEPDAVHRTRVAARRLRSALRTYRRLFDDAAVRRVTDDLRWLGRQLAPARDTEVIYAKVEAGLEAMGDELLLGPVRARTTRHFGRAEEQGRHGAVAALESIRYAELRGGLHTLLTLPPVTRKATRRADKELPRHVRRAAVRLDRTMDDALTAAPAEVEVRLHTARKRAKRLRYATEVARPVIGKKARRYAGRTKRLTKVLGEHQDTVAMRAVLRELATEAQLAGENGFTFGVLHGRQLAGAESIRAEVPKTWRKAGKAKYRRWLG